MSYALHHKVKVLWAALRSGCTRCRRQISGALAALLLACHKDLLF
jgi:hypothetical protein